jgi:hypothetical protein
MMENSNGMFGHERPRSSFFERIKRTGTIQAALKMQALRVVSGHQTSKKIVIYAAGLLHL